MNPMNPLALPPREPSSAHGAMALVACLAITAAAAALGALASVQAPTFYAQLQRPAWAPPAGVFGPVWSLLYLMMAVAAWLVWREVAHPGRTRALVLHAGQLLLNALWSWLFFAWHQGAWALVDIVALWLLIAATLAAFWRVRPLAAVLLVPYLAWVSFATALNAAVWQANPTLLG